MNILLIVKDRVNFFTLKNFLEKKENKVLDIGISPLYKDYSETEIIEKVDELFLQEKVDLVLFDLFLKSNECNLPDGSNLLSVTIANDIHTKNKNIKIAFMTHSALNTYYFHLNYKNVNPNWLLIHKPTATNHIIFADGEEEYLDCPYECDNYINCQIDFESRKCKKIFCFYNLILLASSYAYTPLEA